MEHYYSKRQSSRLRIIRIRAFLRGNSLDFETGSGVFSVGRVDKGTELLANKCHITEGQRILDLGCGYGAVGIAIAKAFSECSVVMSDVNERAVLLATKNIRLNSADNAEAVCGEGFENIKGKFDTVLFNPPQTAGKNLCIRLMEESRDYLKEGGALQAVIRHRIGGKDMSRRVAEAFGNVEVLAIKSGYRIYCFRRL